MSSALLMLARRKILILGEDDTMKMKKIAEVCLEEDSKELVVEGLNCEKVLATLTVPSTLASTSYDYAEFFVNGLKALESNLKLYQGQHSECFVIAEIIEDAILAQYSATNGSVMGFSNLNVSIRNVEIEKIQKVSCKHAAAGGIFPAGTQMIVWGC